MRKGPKSAAVLAVMVITVFNMRMEKSMREIY